MPVPRRIGTVVATIALLTSACGGGSATQARQQASSSATTPAAVSPAEPSSSSPPAADGTAITTSASQFGVMLFDEHSQAIYLFDKETSGQPDCYADCAAAWPPVLATGDPQASGDVRPDRLGTVQRTDGTTQVTYAGHPLYYYAHEGPGEVLCHGVVEYGGTWLVVTPEGTPAP
jgi:predicted lipoprotein with Yx(FWY)xxD motif